MSDLKHLIKDQNSETAYRISEQEFTARSLLVEKKDEYRERVLNSLEIINIEDGLGKQNSFNSIRSSDGSSAKFETTSGHLEKAGICAVVTGGTTNIENFKDVELFNTTIVEPSHQQSDIIKLSMHDLEYLAIAHAENEYKSANSVCLKDGSLSSVLWDMAKMNHFDHEFNLNSNPEIMQIILDTANEGRLIGSPKRNSNKKSPIVNALSAYIPNLNLISEKEILSQVLKNNEILLLKDDGTELVNQAFTSGFAKKTSQDFINNSRMANLVMDYKSLFINNYRSIFLKIAGNPHPIKLEFLNPSMLENFNFLKGIEIEMKGITAVPFAQLRADLLAKKGRKLAKKKFEIKANYGKSSTELKLSRSISFRN